jgi:hypothetical protein
MSSTTPNSLHNNVRQRGSTKIEHQEASRLGLWDLLQAESSLRPRLIGDTLYKLLQERRSLRGPTSPAQLEEEHIVGAFYFGSCDQDLPHIQEASRKQPLNEVSLVRYQ